MKNKTCAALLLFAAAAAARGGGFPDYIPFDASHSEYPEGVAVDKVGNVYVSIQHDNSDQVWKFSPSGQKSVLIDFGPPGGGNCGLAVDAEGNVYMARKLPGYGVYKVDRAGNSVVLPGTEQIFFPNALAFDQRGNLFVTETVSLDASRPGGFGMGGIWVVPKDGGPAQLWLRDELLTGVYPEMVLGYPVGANGIAYYHNALYVANTDKALIARVPVQPDGSPGVIELWAKIQEVPGPFAGGPFPVMPDDFTLDVHGNAYVGVISREAVVRINASDRSQETLAAFPSDPRLDMPCGAAFGTGKGERTCIFVTNLGYTSLFAPGFPGAGPGLVKLDVGVPGLPLP